MVIVETLKGRIDTEKREYYSTRKPEHFFIKYQGFGISDSEIREIMVNNINIIIITYFGKEKLLRCKIKASDVFGFNTYIDRSRGEDDKQYIIPKSLFFPIAE